MTFKKATLLLLTLSLFHIARSQELNTITTAVPFASLVTNPQSIGSGLIGVVASDLNTQNGLDQNPALLSRGKKIMGFQLNYDPWLREVDKNFNLYELGYYQSIGQNNAIGFSARYFKLGEIYFNDSYGNYMGVANPWELIIALKYAHNFSDHFSMGVGFKYIHSDLTSGIIIGNTKTHPGTSLACDLGFDYRRYLIQGEKYKLKWNAGLAIVNFGSKIKYTDESGSGDFIPQDLKIGTMFTSSFILKDSSHIALDIAYQADKLLVPTPPIYGIDSDGNEYIIDGMDPDVSVVQGAIQSFYDAPGGVEEELHEIMHHVGTEARVVFFDNKILAAIRWGYFYEHETKGDRKFNTFGFGVGYAGFRFDFSKLYPTEERSPLQDTWAISIGARFNLGEGPFFKFLEE